MVPYETGTWEPKINALDAGMAVESFTPSIRINMKQFSLQMQIIHNYPLCKRQVNHKRSTGFSLTFQKWGFVFATFSYYLPTRPEARLEPWSEMQHWLVKVSLHNSSSSLKSDANIRILNQWQVPRPTVSVVWSLFNKAARSHQSDTDVKGLVSWICCTFLWSWSFSAWWFKAILLFYSMTWTPSTTNRRVLASTRQ